MVRKALLLGAPATMLAFGAGLLAGGIGTAWSAGLGVAVVVLNFAAHGRSLAWAADVSITMVQVVALVGFVARMGIIVGLLFALDATAWFSPLVFALAAVSSTIALLTFEAGLVKAGLGAELQIPADPAAVAANRALKIKEAR